MDSLPRANVREHTTKLNAWLVRTVAMTNLSPTTVLVQLRERDDKRAAVAQSLHLVENVVNGWAIDQLRNIERDGQAAS